MSNTLTVRTSEGSARNDPAIQAGGGAFVAPDAGALLVEADAAALPGVPTIALMGLTYPGPAIVDTGTPSLSIAAEAGTTVTITSDSVAEGSATPTGTVLGTGIQAYQASPSPPLSPGAHQLSAIASNSAGSTSSDPVSLFVLPGAVDGTITAAVSSLQFSTLVGEGYAVQLVSNVQAIELTDGTLSLGANTGAGYMERLYEGLLGRPGDPDGLAGYNAILNQQGPAAVATDILASQEFTMLHGQVGSLTNDQYVTLLYDGLLRRSPEANSLAADVSALAGGLSRGALAANIATSAEAERNGAPVGGIFVPDPTGALITKIYETALNRAPDLPGLAGDVQALLHGSTPLDIANAVAASAEFLADHAGQSAAQLVTSFYANGLGRTPDPVGLQVYTSAIQAGATGSALLAIASSSEASAHLLRTPSVPSTGP